MQRIIIIGLAALAIAAVVYALTRPEPTPAERLSEAAQEAGEAAQDAVEELAAVAEETAEAVQEEAQAKVEEIQSEAAASMDALSAELTDASTEARTQLETFVQDWRDTGIVTAEGVDFEAAIAAVDEADLDADTKTEVNSILEFIRDLPGEAKAKLAALEQSL